MSDPNHKPRHPRIRTRFEALYSLGRQEGAGVLADISYSGAHIEDSSLVPEVGTEVRIYVFVQPVSPFSLSGKVVRVTENGFALAYQNLDDEIRRLVDDAAALVG
jgi:hypothetical protein